MHSGGMLALSAGLLFCGCGDPLFFVSQERVVDGQGEHFRSAGCMELADDSGASNGSAVGGADLLPPPYTVSYRIHEDAAEVHVDVVDGTIVERRYGAAFLRSGREDELVVDLPDGSALHLRNWGAPDCEDLDRGLE